MRELAASRGPKHSSVQFRRMVQIKLEEKTIE